MVVASGGLHVRAYRGTRSAWFEATHEQSHGRIWVGKRERDVEFTQADPAHLNEIDAAYQRKYGHQGVNIIAIMNSPPARAATIEITPR
jgi:hypothetical protein